MPREDSFLVPLKYIDVIRTTHTYLDMMLEKQIEDYWNVDGEKELIVRCVDRVHKICSIVGKATGRIFLVPGDLQGNKILLVLTMCGQISGSICPMQQRRQQNKDGLSRNQSSTMPDNWEEYSLLNQKTKNL